MVVSQFRSHKFTSIANSELWIERESGELCPKKRERHALGQAGETKFVQGILHARKSPKNYFSDISKLVPTCEPWMGIFSDLILGIAYLKLKLVELRSKCLCF
ncbi:hypothetical protein AMTRI_Chr05g71120 [Amborella trichopoda]